jgi:hypothetical protein
MDVALYTPPNDSAMAVGLMVALTLGALTAMQNCTPEDDSVESASPTNVPSAPQKRPKKVSDEMAAELKPMILKFLEWNPGSSVNTMHKIFSRQMPDVTKTNINSCLYTMQNKKMVLMKEDGKERLWFVRT